MSSSTPVTRLSPWFTLGILLLMYTAISIETDIYVPSFPDMVLYFGTTEKNIQNILSANFIGLCLSSLICGPLSDSFGRKRVMLSGLGLFFLSSLGCIWSSSLEMMIFFRFLQGAGAAAPMVAGFAILLDLFTLEQAIPLIGVLNSVITGVMAGAPLVGTWLKMAFDWRANFVLIAALALFSWAGVFLFIPEPNIKLARPKFDLDSIFRSYKKLFLSTKYMSLVLICTLVFSSLIVYTSNLSLIFVNHLNINPSSFAFYQSVTMACFGIASFSSGKFASRFGISATKDVSLLLSAIGAGGLLVISASAPAFALGMCIAMGILGLGSGLGMGAISGSTMEVFPEIKGVASALLGSIRLLLTAGLVTASEIYFSGSMLPVAWIIFGSVGLAGALYLMEKSSFRAAKEGG